jgi:hypothetical protein
VFGAGCATLDDGQTVATVTVDTVEVTMTVDFVAVGRELVVVLYVRRLKNGSHPAVIDGAAFMALFVLIDASGCAKARRRL